MHNSFLSIEYLKEGNEKQKEAYKVLIESRIFNILNKYNPILVGTIPIKIDTNKSDLDIICEVYNFEEFKRVVVENFSNKDDFKFNSLNKVVSVANFYIEGLEIELYAENKKTIEQNAYRHMVIESRILELGGNNFRNEIIKLKESGLKTEPAFGKLLGLEGNSYVELFKIEDMSDFEIKKLIGGKNEERNNKYN